MPENNKPEPTEAPAEPQPVVAKSPSLPVGVPVVYRLQCGPNKGQERPAVVTVNHGDGTANLQVFTDGHGNFTGDGLPSPLWVKNAVYSEAPVDGTWRAIRS